MKITREQYERLKAIRDRANELDAELDKLELEAAAIAGDKDPFRDATLEYVCNGGTLSRYLESLGVTVEEQSRSREP